jgi:signal transduction histidine kinase
VSLSERKKYSGGRTRVVALVGVVVAVGIMLSFFSYAYFLSISDRVSDAMTDELRRQARAEAFHLANLLENDVALVSSHSSGLAISPSIVLGDVERGSVLINNAQEVTDDMTDRYFWLDKEGKTVWSSAFTNDTERQLYQGFDVSDRPYFVNPAQTLEPYISPVIQSPLDRTQRVFFSYPVFSDVAGGERFFEGVVVASIRADALGASVQRQLSKEIESSVGLIDPNGVVVYTSNSSLVGENLFGAKLQSLLAPAFATDKDLTEFNDFMRASLEGSSDSRDFSTITGATSTVTYLPISVNVDPVGGNEEPGRHFLTLYVTAPHNIAIKVNPLVDQVRNFSIGVIIAISSVTIVVAYVVFLWNRTLEKLVVERTASLNEANEQLKLHDKMQAEFINIAAHELRTPVQPIKGVAEMARLISHQSRAGDDGKIELDREEIDMLYRNATRLEKLTENILDVTKIESQTLRLKHERFDLVHEIRTVVNEVQRHQNTVRIDQRNVIRYDGPSEPIMIQADRTRIYGVLSNLLGNAGKFTEGGTITITTKIEKPDEVLVAITDTGKGIDSSILPRLFTKFATNSESGTGLGLYISKNVIEAHGGRMWAENNADGSGATFFFTLPLLTAESQRTEVASAQVRERENVG